jgi:hypothetical protein
MMYDEILYLFNSLRLRKPVLDFRASLMMKMNDSHAEYGFIYFMISFIILIHNFLEQECLSLEFLIELRDEDIVELCGQLVLGCNCICL